MDETTPHRAKNDLGRIRIDLEAAYRAAGVKTIILRGGDFIDTEASGNWFDKVIAAKAKRGVLVSPGDAEAPHAWAWLPDMARAAVELAEQREALETFEDVPFPGFTLSLNEMAEMAGRTTGRRYRVTRMSWLPLQLVSPFWAMGRRLLEMRYLWNMPHRLSSRRFNDLLPGFRTTDAGTALATAIGAEIEPDQTMPRGTAYFAAE